MNKRQEILEKRLDGMTYEAIGKSMNLSRQRVQQLISPPKEIRDLVVNRASGRCEKCGILVGRSGHCHHIGNLIEDYNDTDNLQLLCISCHHKAHHLTKLPIRKTKSLSIRPKIRCPNCSSSMTYIRILSFELVCHTCGQITPLAIYCVIE